MVAPRPIAQDWEIVLGWIAACVLVVFMLPLLGMLYFDVLEAKQQAKTQLEKVEKLRREVEKKQREQNEHL